MAKETVSSITCSVCLEEVAADSRRSTAKLQCGHEFHLDCIGSVFNAKGAMQCPNCRDVENGEWRFADNEFIRGGNDVDDDPDILMLPSYEVPPYQGHEDVNRYFEGNDHDLPLHHEPFAFSDDHANDFNWSGQHMPGDVHSPHALQAIEYYRYCFRHHFLVTPMHRTNNGSAGGNHSSALTSTPRNGWDPRDLDLLSETVILPYRNGAVTPRPTGAPLIASISLPFWRPQQLPASLPNSSPSPSLGTPPLVRASMLSGSSHGPRDFLSPEHSGLSDQTGRFLFGPSSSGMVPSSTGWLENSVEEPALSFHVHSDASESSEVTASELSRDERVPGWKKFL